MTTDLERDLLTHCGNESCRACQTCRDRMAEASYEIERLNAALAEVQAARRRGDEIVAGMATLFGSRFHTDTQCGSCGGPLECDRDAICHRCTDEMEIERLRELCREFERGQEGMSETIAYLEWQLQAAEKARGE